MAMCLWVCLTYVSLGQFSARSPNTPPNFFVCGARCVLLSPPAVCCAVLSLYLHAPCGVCFGGFAMSALLPAAALPLLWRCSGALPLACRVLWLLTCQVTLTWIARSVPAHSYYLHHRFAEHSSALHHHRFASFFFFAPFTHTSPLIHCRPNADVKSVC